MDLSESFRIVCNREGHQVEVPRVIVRLDIQRDRHTNHQLQLTLTSKCLTLTMSQLQQLTHTLRRELVRNENDVLRLLEELHKEQVTMLKLLQFQAIE